MQNLFVIYYKYFVQVFSKHEEYFYRKYFLNEEFEVVFLLTYNLFVQTDGKEINSKM